MVGILICVSSSAFGTSTTVTMDDSSPRQPPGDSIVYEPANAWVGADEFDSSCRGEDTSTNRGGLVGVSVEEQRSWCEMLGRVNATMASENTWHAPRPRPQRPIHETNVSQSDTTTLKPWSGEDTPTVRVHFNGSAISIQAIFVLPASSLPSSVSIPPAQPSSIYGAPRLNSRQNSPSPSLFLQLDDGPVSTFEYQTSQLSSLEPPPGQMLTSGSASPSPPATLTQASFGAESTALNNPPQTQTNVVYGMTVYQNDSVIGDWEHELVMRLPAISNVLILIDSVIFTYDDGRVEKDADTASFAPPATNVVVAPFTATMPTAPPHTSSDPSSTSSEAPSSSSSPAPTPAIATSTKAVALATSFSITGIVVLLFIITLIVRYRRRHEYVQNVSRRKYAVLGGEHERGMHWDGGEGPVSFRASTAGIIGEGSSVKTAARRNTRESDYLGGGEVIGVDLDGKMVTFGAAGGMDTYRYDVVPGPSNVDEGGSRGGNATMSWYDPVDPFGDGSSAARIAESSSVRLVPVR